MLPVVCRRDDVAAAPTSPGAAGLGAAVAAMAVPARRVQERPQSDEALLRTIIFQLRTAPRRRKPGVITLVQESPTRCPATPTSCADQLEPLLLGEQVACPPCFSFVRLQLTVARGACLPVESFLTPSFVADARSFEHAGRAWAGPVPGARGCCS